MLTAVKVLNYDVWFVRIKKQGTKYGYSNFCWSTNLVLGLVLELLEAKKNGKKYEIGDCIVLGDYLLVPPGTLWCQIHILKKQEIGWDVVDGDLAEMDKFLPENFQRFIRRNGLMMHQVKDCFVRVMNILFNDSLRELIQMVFSAGRLTIKPVITENLFEYLEPPGEYLSKVYSGEDYFNDYDCFV
uniref:Uncharacterized protein n=1 Tax=Panagrolaimus sp. JU765 TaxID=591449 RepID=A0AC34RCB7_9BILA